MQSIIGTFISLSIFYHSSLAFINTQYYPSYHLAPEYGWMNDPNGFSYFQGYYHLFYQYNPKSSQEPGIAHWAHSKSKDLMNWKRLPIAMYPDKTYDKDGVFSGSAIVEDDTLYIFYTGNVNLEDKVINRNETQALSTCTDGITVNKYEKNPIMLNKNLQPNIRDPKVWKHNNAYYMVLGNSLNNTFGQIVLFKSMDKLSWKEVSVIHKSNGTLGYMFECPDLFKLNGRFVLLFSPQGIQPDGYKYKNLYQTGYIVGKFDYKTNKFSTEIDFRELDSGHDFYATQTLLDKQGRRIMFSWLDMWEQVYPERNDGWTGQMSLPRVLTLTDDGVLLQNPAKEVDLAKEKVLFRGNKNPGAPVILPNKAGKVTIESAADESLEVFIESSGTNISTVSLQYNPDTGFVVLDRGGNDGVRMTPWKPECGNLKWQIYIDTSSVELFCGNGEVTFSSRFFPKTDVSVGICKGNVIKMEVVSFKRTLPLPNVMEKC